MIKPSACDLPVSNGSARCNPLGKMRLLAIAIGAQALVSTSIAATLEDVSYTTLPGNQQEIAFKLSESVSETSSFQIDYPARIAIDLMGTTNALDTRVVPVGAGNVESVNIVEANDRTRVVLNLEQMADYQTEIDGNILRVTVSGDTDAQGEPQMMQDFSESDELLTGTTEVEDIDDGGVVLELPASLPLDYTGDDLNETVQSETDLMMNETMSDPVATPLIDVQTGAPVEEMIEPDAMPSTVEMPSVPPMPKVDDMTYKAPDNGVDYSTPTAPKMAPASLTSNTRINCHHNSSLTPLFSTLTELQCAMIGISSH
ncbi:MAG: AMIN domain-containing protein, partial [Pseudomonadota bacterium]